MKLLLILGSGFLISWAFALEDACNFQNNTTASCGAETTIQSFNKFFTENNGTLITTLNLTNCKIPTLPTEFFRKVNLTNLIEINIDNCALTKIEEKTFFGLPKMKKLVIINNNIQQLIPNQFDNMRALNELILESNKIVEIPAYTFNGLNGLVHISLENNNIQVLKKDFLQTSGYIESVNLRNGGVRKIEPFAFGFISNLREIDLTGNVIPHLKANSFMGLGDMESLNLSSLSIRTIDPKTFTSMDKLQNLDLTHNEIQNITVDTFYGLGNLRTLSLLGNDRITHIMNNSFFGLNELEELRLPKYCYKNISTGFFSGLTNLQQLDLSNMGMTEINPEVFQGLLNLETLNISQNQIKRLKYNTFYKLPKLKSLDLSSNTLKDFGIELAICTYNNYLKTVEINSNPWNCQRLFNMLNHLDQLNITYDKSFSELPYINCQGITYNRASRQGAANPIKNIKRICEQLPIEIENENGQTTTTGGRTETIFEATKRILESTTVANIRAIIDAHIDENKLEIDYKTVFIILGVAVGFSFILVHLVVKAIRNGPKSPGYHIYHFNGPTAETQAAIAYESQGYDNPAVHDRRFSGFQTKFEVA